MGSPSFFGAPLRLVLLAAALLAAGCGWPREPATGAADAAFPHDAAFATEHRDDGSCGSCHGLREGELVREADPVAPACRSCHPGYPHPPSLSDGGAHGAAWLDNPSACASCHGADGTRAPGGDASAACTACHSTFPHPDAWTDAHGDAARERGPLSCAGCHGVQGDDHAESACTSCHADYPHPAGFLDEHGAAFAARGEQCAACHQQGEPHQVACSTCHDLFPHGDDLKTSHRG